MTAPVPAVQRAHVLREDLTLVMEERVVPEPGPGEVLVQVRSVGVCGSDIHYFEHGRIADFIVESPMILGHESSGTVVALGAGVEDLPLGTTVALEPGIPCSACDQCRAGRYNLCPDVRFFATPPIDGTFCDYVVVPRAFAHPVPDHVSYDAAALVEPLSVGVWACRKAKVGLGTRVLVTGAGPVGMMAALVARASGAAHVVITDTNAARRSHAAGMGFTVIDPSSVADEVAVDVLLECSGAPAAVDAGIRAVVPAGTIVLVGMSPTTMVELPVGVIQARELWVTGTFRYAHAYPVAIDLVASGAVDLDALVSHTFPLEQAEEALLQPRRDPATMKVVVRVSS